MAVELSAEQRRALSEAQGKSKGVIAPWSSSLSAQDDNIIPKRGKWDQYYNMYKRHSIVRTAIDKIAKTATNVGFDFVPRDSRSKIRKGEVRILKQFFDEQQDFIYELRRVYKDLLIYGDAFMYIVPDRQRRPHSLKRLAPNTMAVRADKSGHVLGYVQFDPNDPAQMNYTTFESHEIIHIRLDDPDNDLYGLSPLESLEWAVAADIYAQRYNAAFFQNSGITGTIISVTGVDPDEIQRNREFLIQYYTGPDAAHKPVFLEGESVKVEKSVATHSEMGFLEGRKFIIMEILAVLDVPPAKIGIMESANRSNSKEQDKTFRSESVAPLQYIIESALNSQFIQPILGVKNTIFVHSEGDTRDAIELMDYYKDGINWGIFNINEVRAKMGMAPVEGGDFNAVMTPTGFVPLDRLNLYFQLPQQNTDKIPPVPADPPQGERPPASTTNVATGVSREASKSFNDPRYANAEKAIMALIRTHNLTRSDVVKSYSYMSEALGVEPEFDTMFSLMKKVIEADDPIIGEGYIERIKETFIAWIERKQDEQEN